MNSSRFWASLRNGKSTSAISWVFHWTSPTFTDLNVLRETFSQILEYWPENTHLNSFLADTEAFKTLLLRQNPIEQLRVVLTLCPLWIIADVELLDLLPEPCPRLTRTLAGVEGYFKWFQWVNKGRRERKRREKNGEAKPKPFSTGVE